MDGGEAKASLQEVGSRAPVVFYPIPEVARDSQLWAVQERFVNAVHGEAIRDVGPPVVFHLAANVMPPGHLYRLAGIKHYCQLLPPAFRVANEEQRFYFCVEDCPGVDGTVQSTVEGIVSRVSCQIAPFR